MSVLKSRFGSPRRAKKPRVFVLGVDGLPFTYLQEEIAADRMPNFARLVPTGSLARMRSSLPFVSSTAWTTFFTGRNPGGHGVFGFTSCRPDSHELYFPNYEHISVPTLWDLLGEHGRRSIVLNVPGTYPARPLSGVLVSGFVAPRLERAVHPTTLLPRLRALGYRVEVDAWAGRRSVDELESDLFLTFERRVAVIRELLEQEDWDLFIGVVTETDRLYHLLWNRMADGEPQIVDLFQRFHARVDELLGWLLEALPDGTRVMMLSDHGFTREVTDVYTNVWLRERGLLRLDEEAPRDISALAEDSLVYSLDPGRFYVNVAGRRPKGRVPLAEREAVVQRLVAELADLRDPDTGRLVYSQVVRREDIYDGPYLEAAPDVVLVPSPGYELKSSTRASTVFAPPSGGLGGMHTYDDALIFVPGVTDVAGLVDLHDVAPTIVDLLGLPTDAFEGRSLTRSTVAMSR